MHPGISVENPVGKGDAECEREECGKCAPHQCDIGIAIGPFGQNGDDFAGCVLFGFGHSSGNDSLGLRIEIGFALHHQVLPAARGAAAPERSATATKSAAAAAAATPAAAIIVAIKRAAQDRTAHFP